jgi:hypothetical protein
MQGKALTWYNSLMESGHTGGWEEFVVALKVRFAPSAYDDPIGAFTKLTQPTTVEEYQSEFEVLSNRISGLTEEFRVHTFLSGLKEEIRIMVTMLKPNCLSAAFGLARLQEEEVLRRDHNQQVNTWSSNSNYQINQPSYSRLPAPNFYAKPVPIPIPLDSHSPQPNPAIQPSNNNQNTYNRKPNIPVRRISPTQMQERRKKGLCYFCDERYQPGHRCNRPKIYLIEGMGMEEESRMQEGAEETLPVEELEEATWKDHTSSGRNIQILWTRSFKTNRLLWAMVGSPTRMKVRSGNVKSGEVRKRA